MLLDNRPPSLREETPSTASHGAGRRSLVADLDDELLAEGDEGFDLDGGDDDGFINQMAASPRAEQLSQPAAAPAPKPVQRKAAAVGGNDALGRKENKLLQWKQEMIEVAKEMEGQFTPLGLTFRPQILLATAMQEADAKDPLNGVSFDKGVGLMQITPYKGKLDPAVAKAINWDNSKSVSENIKTSNWRNAKANLMAGALTMLGKAKAIKRGASSIWEKMDEQQRWRAVLYAYNAGEGGAIKALKAGGPNARMISTYTDPKGRRVSHDYTKEFQDKFDYVDSHDPFGGESSTSTGGAQTEPGTTSGDQGDKADESKTSFHLVDSVGRGGKNRKADVTLVQDRLGERGVSPGKVDGVVGPKTIGAIETFQEATIHMADGLISPGKNTEKHLFGESGRVGAKPVKQEPAAEHATTGDKKPEAEQADGQKEEKDHPSWAAIAANFNSKISGTAFTWHEAFWLPSWNRHVKPSDVTNISIDQLIANVEKQAAALTDVREAIGKSIVVHCWVRPPAYNKQIGGASNSAHLRGMATDFHCTGMSAEQVRQAVKSRKLYPGAGENNVSWVHLDLEHSRWFSP